MKVVRVEWEWSVSVRVGFKHNWLSFSSSLSISLRLPGRTGLVQGHTWLSKVNCTIISLPPYPRLGYSFVYHVSSLTRYPLKSFPIFPLSFLLKNFLSVIIHLQETWKIQNKVTYNFTIYYNWEIHSIFICLSCILWPSWTNISVLGLFL